ncbi:hypothetical protein GPJ56_006978 [Histomonas meleagridis]|uniref:uncharacterized protein n=1 Tax=Histomonas meleagridis TaxID=135588 RepID=UPI003559FE62|nr:hypothetical protein GPJ56_006978 [Histomonas meleagridis]KAH0797762.1 hypothetical protein GO595_009391 [Histomonas meleagridis]
MSLVDNSKQRFLKYLSEASGERVVNWERVSHGDIICFILNRMSPGCINLKQITDGVDRFARVGNWRLAAQAMRKLGIGWAYDEVRLVMADQAELVRVVLAIRRWETRNLKEPLEPPVPGEWDNEIPQWFTQQTAKEFEEKRLASGETARRKPRQNTSNIEIEARRKARLERKTISEMMRGK